MTERREIIGRERRKEREKERKEGKGGSEKRKHRKGGGREKERKRKDTNSRQADLKILLGLEWAVSALDSAWTPNLHLRADFRRSKKPNAMT